ncbi:hypothetical protein TIFTF001_031512 [Ficus carica]|uniref:Uncharacterized protein n=1 Tax=Ficus carica TaxID=3494 RepID=A0AA88DX64_FICCA|nr:hypothetical protein TIFTF001_031512 [Ficus carica]
MLTKDKSLGKNENPVSRLAAPTTLWLRAKVSNLMAICDARRWSMAGRTVKSWDKNRYAFCYV